MLKRSFEENFFKKKTKRKEKKNKKKAKKKNEIRKLKQTYTNFKISENV